MTIPTLGTLTEVNLREAWDHEAHSFTPWLAEHLETLAAVVGTPLELVDIEVAVESFSADILARNPQDDSLVLIENQLEGTNHSHLGQIMTYLAGLNTHTVIWIAAEFKEAHLSAINWLNEHTVDPYAFFAVKVRAVRIGNSPIAPIFEVISKPNQWERQLQAISQETQQPSAIGQFRNEFWSYYIQRFPDEAEVGPAGYTSNRWREIESLNIIISYYVARNSVGIFLRSPRGGNSHETYKTLSKHQEKLEQHLGVDIGDPNGEYFFGTSKKGKSSNRELWEELCDWLHDTLNTYDTTLKQIAEELD